VVAVDYACTAAAHAVAPAHTAVDHRALSLLGVLVMLAAAPVVLRWLPGRRVSVVVGVAVGGGVANLLERVATGSVIDWIPFAGYVWNLADVALFGTAPLLLWAMLRRDAV
jgi:signal peptidase II